MVLTMYLVFPYYLGVGMVACTDIQDEQLFNENSVYPRCLTLKRYRRNANLNQSLLSVLCYIGMIQSELERQRIDPTHPLNTMSPSSLIAAILFLRTGPCLDSIYLSKFECGHQKPWPKAREVLCYVFSIVYRRPITEEELFPELEGLDNDPFGEELRNMQLHYRG